MQVSVERLRSLELEKMLDEVEQKHAESLEKTVKEAESRITDVRRYRRDLSLQGMFKSWGGGVSAKPVEEFLDNLEEVAACGNWTEEDKFVICKLKLHGPAAACSDPPERKRQSNITSSGSSRCTEGSFWRPEKF